MRFTLLLLALAPSSAFGLDPARVLVLVNKRVPASRQVADHFCTRRGVPAENVVELVLPVGEDISRDEYNRFLAGPVRDAVAARKGAVTCLVTTFGVPLRVGSQEPTAAEKAAVAAADAQLAAATKDSAEWRTLDAKRKLLSHSESNAAVDSELMLVLWPQYPTARWVPNPLYWQVKPASRAKAPPTLMVARLDGSDADAAKKLVDDAIAAEIYGLSGKAYVDARGMKFTPGQGTDVGYGYAGFDESFREAAGVLKAGFETVLDDKPELFAADSCPDIALYMGWYALMNYKKPGTFNRGAVAWHLASGEAVTLRDPKSKAWCPNLLRDGACVTLGPVAEPYTVAFPKPAEFAGFLLAGKDSIVEVYSKTVPTASWMTVLVGDPFYTPFRKAPKPWVPAASPKGGVVVFN